MTRGDQPAFTQPGAALSGLTIREWLTGQVLSGICANGSYDDTSFETAAEHAVVQADATLAALDEHEKSASGHSDGGTALASSASPSAPGRVAPLHLYVEALKFAGCLTCREHVDDNRWCHAAWHDKARAALALAGEKP